MPRRPQEALAELLAGNRRFVAGRSRYGHHISAAAAASGGQNPYAVVLGCIDSRVPVEAVFDQTFGMICVIRSGGHVLDRAVLGSVAFAVDALDVPLIVVLGHDRCGAVSATVEALRGGTRPVGELGYLVDEIGAAADGTDLTDPAAVHLVTSAHTIRTVERLRAGQPDVTVVGARYDLDTGQVRLLS
ncbi:MAG: carbonic anhydrase [Actinobacteria bacterium 13_2_20CM_2_71_6]|nr:MAG: carbonic anhydrase [Actinobacteria bacterium 13_2_20CM_2_71_6]